MTRKECIYYLGKVEYMDANEKEAIDMAIEILSEPCGNHISRDKEMWLTEYTEEEVEKEFPNIAKYSTLTDHISRADAVNIIMSEPMNEPRYPIWFADKIKILPSAEPKTGEWIFEETDEYKRTYCSVCGAAAPFVCVSDDHYGRRSHGEVRKTKFCPNCGADMRGENK